MYLFGSVLKMYGEGRSTTGERVQPNLPLHFSSLLTSSTALFFSSCYVLHASTSDSRLVIQMLREGTNAQVLQQHCCDQASNIYALKIMSFNAHICPF